MIIANYTMLYVFYRLDTMPHTDWSIVSDITN